MGVIDAFGADGCAHDGLATGHAFHDLNAEAAARPERNDHHLVLREEGTRIVNLLYDRDPWLVDVVKMERHATARDDKPGLRDSGFHLVPTILQEPGHRLLVLHPVHA